jgi:hypothetical protein
MMPSGNAGTVSSASYGMLHVPPWQHVASLLCCISIYVCRMDVVRYLSAMSAAGQQPRNFKPEDLIQAAAADDAEMVESLLLAHVDVNSMDFDNRTALHLAVANKSMKVTGSLNDAYIFLSSAPAAKFL